MLVFKIHSDNSLEYVPEEDFALEKDMQRLTETNLSLLFGLECVSSEFSVGSFRIDTLAFHPQEKYFVIIEYKKDKNLSVVDQGYSYLSVLLNNKADFILEYNEKTGKKLRREEVDWSQSRILFLSPSFTVYQREAINFKDLPIELWEVKRFGKNLVIYSKVSSSQAAASIKELQPRNGNATIKKVSGEIHFYTEKEHLEKASEAVKELYERLKYEVLNLGTFEVKPKKVYIAFVGRTNILDVQIQKNSLKLWLNVRKGRLNDPLGIARDVSAIGHHGNGDYEIHVTPDSDLDYLMTLIRQSVKLNLQ